MSDLPNIRRPSIRPLDEWIDDFMRGFGVEVIDPAKPETLARLRRYTRQWLKRCLESTTWDLQRGAKRGMKQSLEFMFDPRHAETLKQGRKDRKERREAKRREEHVAELIKENRISGKLQ